MLFTSIVSFAFLGAALAAPMEKRQVATIQTAIKNVGTALTNLDTSIKAVNAAGDTAKILAMSQAVQTALTTGTTMVMAGQAITLQDALGLQQTTGALTTQVTTVVTDLMAKKAIIQQAGQTQTTLQSLMSQKTASTAFAKAVTSKVPAGVQNIASNQSSMIGAALDKGIAAFGGPPAPAA